MDEMAQQISERLLMVKKQREFDTAYEREQDRVISGGGLKLVAAEEQY